MIVGQIGKPHGTAGDVYVMRISDDPRRFEPGSVLRHEDGRILVVESSRVHRDRFLVSFEGSESRSDAEALRGTLFVPASEVRDLEAGEFWEHDVIGCEVVTKEGERVGEVAAIIPGAAQDLLEVSTPRGPRLMPFVKEIVTGIDRESRRVTIDPPAGLLD